MSIGPLIGIASNYLESLFANHTSGSSTATTSPVNTAGNTQDTNQLSPFAQILSSLQQVAQSNPSQYQEVAQQISGNLQSAAQTATANGDTNLANELTKLSGDFSNASSSGQLPNIQDLAQAIGGGHHGHFHHHPAGAGESTESNSPTSNSSSVNSTNDSSTMAGSLNQLVQSLNASQTGMLANNSLNPMNIIEDTLSSAGISGV